MNRNTLRMHLLTITLLVLSVCGTQAIAAAGWDIKQVEAELATISEHLLKMLGEVNIMSAEFKAALENTADPDRVKTMQAYQNLINNIELNWMVKRQLEHKRCLLNGGSIEKADICIQEWFDADRSMTEKIKGWSIFKSQSQ
jgi:hypothetical protein